MGKQEWSGVFPAIAVPLKSDLSIDEPGFRRYVRWLAGIDGLKGLVVNGHTGEITCMSREERKRLAQIAVEEVEGKLSIVSGVSSESTAGAIEDALAAQEAGAAGILLMPPHLWLRFGMKKAAPVKFFSDVASAIDIKIIVHLYPAWCKAFYPVETLLEMAKIPNVVAVKMGTRDMAKYENDVLVLKKNAPHIALLSCHDEYLLPTLILGADGALVGFAGCVPELIVALWRAVEKQDMKEAVRLEEKVFPMKKAIYGMGEPSGEAHARLKEALFQMGIFDAAYMRPPVMPLDDEEKSRVTQALREVGLIK
ncbi:MAG: dihydrodipicolinate synthase family protein [Firmicutes bacterium]|jgi:4-hydroxy-tetrahydrodipicolinate synthase|nr:dihydrodipicolinate synthase family protein [Bacillota bacterium]